MNTRFQKWLDRLKNPWRPVVVILICIGPMELGSWGWTPTPIRIICWLLFIAVAVSRFVYVRKGPHSLAG